MGTVNIKTAEVVSQEAKESHNKALEAEVQRYADEVAKSRGYDSLLALCSYATSSNPKFSAEGQAGVIWRDSLWDTWYQIAAEVESGERPVPSVEEVSDLLPAIQW